MPESDTYLTRSFEREPSSLSKAAKFIGCGVLGASSLVFAYERGWLDWVPFPDLTFLETTNSISGAGITLDHGVYPPNSEISEFFQSGSTKVEDETWGPQNNPKATETSINDISLMFDAGAKPSASFKFNEISGPYLEVVAEGKPEGFNYSEVYIMPYKPQVCKLKSESGTRPEFQGCPDPDDPAYRGATDVNASDGSALNRNSGIMEDVMRYSDIYRINNWCYFSYMLGGVYEGKAGVESGTGDRMLLQARVVAIVRSVYRRSIAEQKNIPVEMVKLPEDIAVINGASEVVLADGLTYIIKDNMFYPKAEISENDNIFEWINRFVKVDSPVARKASILAETLDTVRLPEGFKDEGNNIYTAPMSRTCEPGSEYSKNTFAQMLDEAVMFGGVELQPGLWANGQIDVEAAEAREKEVLSMLEEKGGD
jgi:hypothetical protein